MEELKIYYRKIIGNEQIRPSDIRVDKLSITHCEIPSEAIAKLNIAVNDEDMLENICERLFRVMNNYELNPLSHGHPEGGHQGWISHQRSHTSMSVGDVICVMGEYIMCDDFGWTPIV
tara:strand:- start:10 stop:363 length:354 start_codon:yes stop_codon:yes gene_type:complete